MLEYVETDCQHPLAILNITEAASIVNGDTRLTSNKHLYTETGWQTIREKFEAHKILSSTALYNGQQSKHPGI